MMACHAAGVDREQFIAWSCSDPQYQNDAEEIGRQWDALKPSMCDAGDDPGGQTTSRGRSDAVVGSMACTSLEEPALCGESTRHPLDLGQKPFT